MTYPDDYGLRKTSFILSDTERSGSDKSFPDDESTRLIVDAASHLMNTTRVTEDETRASGIQLRAMIRAAELASSSDKSRGRAAGRRNYSSGQRLSIVRNGLLAILGSVLLAAGVFQVTPYLFNSLGSNATDEGNYNVIATAAGQRSRVELPDGSVALLGPESQIRYGAEFGRRDRIVNLEGEVLFTVTQVSGVPFTVFTNGAMTSVLGTSFTVRRYPTDTATQVVVAEGRVALMGAGRGIGNVRDPVILVSGDRGVVSNNSGDITQVRVTDIGAELAWTRGRVEFNNMELYEVVKEVARMYDVDIRVESESVGRIRITGAIEHGSSKSEAVETLAAAVGARIERLGNTITLATK